MLRSLREETSLLEREAKHLQELQEDAIAQCAEDAARNAELQTLTRELEKLEEQNRQLHADLDGVDGDRLWTDVDEIQRLRRLLADAEAQVDREQRTAHEFDLKAARAKHIGDQKEQEIRKVNLRLRGLRKLMSEVDEVLSAAERADWTGEWACARCTWSNDVSARSCVICDRPKPAGLDRDDGER